MEWVTCALPKPLVDRIDKIYAKLGYARRSTFIQEGVRVHVNRKELEYEHIQAEEEEAIVKKHEEGEESVERQWEVKK